MNTNIPSIRPAILSGRSLVILDKVRTFRHFIGHAYDCELDSQELIAIQDQLRDEYAAVQSDLNTFRKFISDLAS